MSKATAAALPRTIYTGVQQEEGYESDSDSGSTCTSTTASSCTPTHPHGHGHARRVAKRIAIAVLVVVIVLLILYLVARRGPASEGMASGPALGETLTKKSWVLYTLKGCPACVRQEEILHGNGGFRATIMVDRSRKVIGGEYQGPPPLALSSPVFNEGFPLWYNARTEEVRVGIQNEAQLKAMAK